MNLLFLFISACTLVVINGQCKGKVDLVIAVPGDSSVPFYEFAVFEKRIIQLLNHFHIAPNDFNIGLVLYGVRPVDIAWPQPFKNRQQINTRASFLGRRSLYELDITGGLDVSAAIESITWMLTNPPPGYAENLLRHDAKKIGIIFTYGPALDGVDVVNNALLAKQNGVMIYALSANGTGPEFESIGYDRCRLFSMGNFSSGLKSAIPFLASGICSEVDPKVDVTIKDCFPMDYPSVPLLNVKCKRNDTMIEDPNNCAYYFRCVFRKPVPQTCVFNTVFDKKTGACNFKDDVACYANTDLTCTRPTGQFAHPNYCSKFINCFNSSAHVMECPSGMWFNASGSSCASQNNLACPIYKIQ